MKIRVGSMGVVLLGAIASLGLGAATVGCSASGGVAVAVNTPPPPPADRDGDGIPDSTDKCPDQKEDGLPPDPKDGCPSEDPDGDGIKGALDKCPTEPETVNGYMDEDGCPDTPPPPEPPKAVEVAGDQVKLADQIRFKTGSSAIEPTSDELIKKIAAVLMETKDIDFVELAGHADRRGGDAANRPLSQKRVEEVTKRLVAAGVDKNRMRGVGYGSLCPLDPADNEEAYTKNRRVELRILRRAGVDLPTKWGGCEEAESKGMKALAIPDTAPRSTPKDAPVVKVALKSAERTGNKVTLPGDINFQPKKSVLLPAATPTLEALAQFMKENKAVSKLRIEGHTDGDGSGMVELSQARSAAVKAWLVKNGVDASRLVASGCGGKYPELDAHGKKDMAKSRRTETVVLEDDGKAVAGEQPLRAGCKAD